jgi:hypothetical protein
MHDGIVSVIPILQRLKFAIIKASIDELMASPRGVEPLLPG